MAPLHTQSPRKEQPTLLNFLCNSTTRPGPTYKPDKPTSIRSARLQHSDYYTSIMPRIGPVTQASIINTFQIVHQSTKTTHEYSDDDENKPRRRTAYTREQKLAAITYAQSIYKKIKTGELKLISRYAATKELGITDIMLKKWIESSNLIGQQKKGTHRRYRPINRQEKEMEKRLYKAFQDIRLAGRSVSRRWLIRRAKAIYAELYPERISTGLEGRIEHAGFRFSYGWFQGFRKRFRIGF